MTIGSAICAKNLLMIDSFGASLSLLRPWASRREAASTSDNPASASVFCALITSDALERYSFNVPPGFLPDRLMPDHNSPGEGARAHQGCRVRTLQRPIIGPYNALSFYRILSFFKPYKYFLKLLLCGE